MGFLLEKCKLVKLDDKILEICHPLRMSSCFCFLRNSKKQRILTMT